ncbi:MAG TPA: CRTAC1 family protein [Planctomycetaceae bacterium]|nr:CRTAC1 family protein [Planctomycetaceae bacterium]
MSANKPEAQPTEEETGADDAVIGRAFRGSLAVIVCLAVVAGAAAWWLQRPVTKPVANAQPVDLPATRDAPAVQLPKIPFTEITRAAGIDFVHEAGATGMKLLPETMGSGCAFFDFDNDSDPDLLFVNSCPWPWDQAKSPAPTMALYRNDGKGHFDNVTAGSGLDATFYGMGVAVGDYDNDGWTDVFLTAVGKSRLFHNDQGKFVDVTATAGVDGDESDWSSTAGWFDYNRDGKLDLFVCNYVKWSRDIDLAQEFRLVGVGRAYGPPFAFEGTFPRLYKNNGDGTFADVSAAAGIQIKNPATDVPMAKSLGLAILDLDRDGWQDVVLANDTVQNFVLRNKQDGTFEEVGAVSGVAFDQAGNARGAMGIDAAYFRNDDCIGLAIGNFSNEMTALYVSAGPTMQFTDEAIATGLGPPSRLDLKFGVLFADLDLDGRQDLVSANGHLEEEIHQVQASQHYAQAPHVFWNCGPKAKSEFALLKGDSLGPDFVKPLVGRGIASADIDADGDLDLLLTANRGAPRLLRNDQQMGRHWLRVRLDDPAGHAPAVGAVVTVITDSQTQRQIVMPTRGYLSQSDTTLTFGLGSATAVDSLRIVWPDGLTQEFRPDTVDQLIVVPRAKP